ncbi:MAG TPA: hypothetical protein VN903_37650 [Polyangia bacterium]|nr:hypothetical protein [Polyangia bacterium]
MRRRAERALAELGAAAPLGAVWLLLANDHAFKRLYHNAVTGKLSDVAICFFLPLLLSAALGLLTDWPGRRRLAVGAVVATLVFTLLELSDTFGALFARATAALGLGGGTLTRDPTDLLALVCVPLAVAYGRRRLAAAERGPNVWRSATGALVMVTGSLALMATSMSGPVKVCERPAPVMFQAEAGCGPGGLIVVDTDTSFINISNAAALGLPPFSLDMCTWSQGGYRGQEYEVDGGGCTIRLDQSSWEIFVFKIQCSFPSCMSPDGGVTTSSCGKCLNEGACIQVTLQTCSAALADGRGTFTCRPSDGGAPCTSRLTEVRDGGADGAPGEMDGSINPSADGPSDTSPGGS